ncbi:hypothetical protein ETH_00038000, partial [Eimeria tenella]
SLDFYFKPPAGDKLQQFIFAELFVRLANLSLAEAFDDSARAGFRLSFSLGVGAGAASRPFALGLHAFGFSAGISQLLLAAAACLGGPPAAVGDGAPSGAPEALSGAPGGPQGAPEGPSEDLETLPGAPGGPQAAPGGPQGGPQGPQGAPRCPAEPFLQQELLESAWEFFAPQQLLQALGALKAKYLQGAPRGEEWEAEEEAKGEQEEKEIKRKEEKEEIKRQKEETEKGIQRLYKDLVEWGRNAFHQVHVEGLIQ